MQQPIVAYLALNTQRPLFHDNPAAPSRDQLRARPAGARRPVRRATARSRTTSTSRRDSRATRPRHLYPIGEPDLATARRLAQRPPARRATRRSSPAGRRRVSTARWPSRRRSARSACKVDVKTSPGTSQLTLAAVRGTKFDITDVITRPDYGDPYALDRQAARQSRDPLGRQHEPRVLREPRAEPQHRRGAATDRRRPRPCLRPPRAHRRAHGGAARRLRRAERTRRPLAPGRLHHLPGGLRARSRGPLPRAA